MTISGLTKSHIALYIKLTSFYHINSTLLAYMILHCLPLNYTTFAVLSKSLPIFLPSLRTGSLCRTDLDSFQVCPITHFALRSTPPAYTHAPALREIRRRKPPWNRFDPLWLRPYALRARLFPHRRHKLTRTLHLITSITLRPIPVPHRRQKLTCTPLPRLLTVPSPP